MLWRGSEEIDGEELGNSVHGRGFGGKHTETVRLRREEMGWHGGQTFKLADRDRARQNMLVNVSYLPEPSIYPNGK